LHRSGTSTSASCPPRIMADWPTAFSSATTSLPRPDRASASEHLRQGRSRLSARTACPAIKAKAILATLDRHRAHLRVRARNHAIPRCEGDLGARVVATSAAAVFLPPFRAGTTQIVQLERQRRGCAPALGSQATLSRHTNLKMHPFRTSLGLPFYLAVCGSCACRRLPRLQRSCSITRVPGANF
jgi:hypothetical protein